MIYYLSLFYSSIISELFVFFYCQGDFFWFFLIFLYHCNNLKKIRQMQKDFASESTRSYDKNFSFGIVQLPKEHGRVDITKNNQHIVDCFLSFIYLQNCIQEIFLHPTYHLAWSCPRPISISQLHALLHFHLWPIYLVVFKGSYYLRRDISSWGGLHA